MSPRVLHFNVFQAGARTQRQWSLQIEDSHTTTIGSLKRQHFGEAIEAQQSVRFIMSGKILEDKTLLEQCDFGSEAFIYVSISGAAPREATSGVPATEVSWSGQLAKRDAGHTEKEHSSLNIAFFLGAFLFAGAGVLLRLAWQKRWYLSMHVTQMLSVLAAVWVYLLLCHGLPMFLRLFVWGRRELAETAADSVRSPGSCRHCPQHHGPASHGHDL